MHYCRLRLSFVVLACFTLFASGCRYSNDDNIDEEFLKISQEASALYRYGDVNIAKASMEDLEKNLLKYKRNVNLFGIKTRDDYLYITRLRLWGIAVYLRDDGMKKHYEKKLIYMGISHNKLDEISDESLKIALNKIDRNFKPVWLGQDDEQDPKEEPSFKEMIDKGWIRRVK